MKKAVFVLSCVLLGVAAANFIISLLNLTKQD